jgi:DNA-binding NarL/FixJ family response regulator
MTIRLIVADDQATVRDALSVMLDLDDDVDVAASAADGYEAVNLVAEHHPDVVLMDLNMPGMNGIEATRRIRTAHPEVTVVVLTTFGDDESILAALQAGASGYLTKDADRGTILHAVRGAADGHAVLDPAVQRRLLALATQHTAPPASGAAALTAREQEILQLIGEGLRNRQIATRLVISEATVKTHINNLFAKAGLHSRADAVRYALRGRTPAQDTATHPHHGHGR